MKLLSIDPGIRVAGASAWADGTFIWAKLIKGSKAPVPECYTDMVKAIVKSCGKDFDEVVIEQPQVYKEKFQKGRQKDIVNLAGLVGALAVAFSECRVTYYLPREWKGQCPKHVTQHRVLKRLKEGDIKKIKLVSETLNHNIYDAIGIGLHHLNTRKR